MQKVGPMTDSPNRTASEYGNDEIRWSDGLQHYGCGHTEKKCICSLSESDPCHDAGHSFSGAEKDAKLLERLKLRNSLK